jgi:hypothetical protein
MEENLNTYHGALLEALRRHRTKFIADPFQSRPLKNSHDQPLLRNHPEFFETGLLRILSRNGLDNAEILLLPKEKAQEVWTKLAELLGFLNEVATDGFGITPPANISVPSPSASVPDYIDPQLTQLERLLSVLEHSKGPFDIASGTDISIFRIDTYATGKAASSLVKELNQILDATGDIQYQSPRWLPAAAESVSNNTIVEASWIQSFDQAYRKLVGRILDTLYAEFVECELGEKSAQHQVIIRLLGISWFDTSNSKTSLDVYISCSRSNKWQNTRCKLKR